MVSKTLEEQAHISADELAAWKECEIAAVYGQDWRSRARKGSDGRLIPVENGIGARGNPNNERHYLALRRAEGPQSEKLARERDAAPR
jgi:hypothetical protein